MIKRMLTAAAFSLLYVSMYPILTGGFVVYVYPYWPPPLAITYILLGILLQAWFCFGRNWPATGGTLMTQVGAGVLYAAASLAFSGGCYQS
jgi:hypothetical protein